MGGHVAQMGAKRNARRLLVGKAVKETIMKTEAEVGGHY
jgi:hypothetical protein